MTDRKHTYNSGSDGGHAWLRCECSYVGWMPLQMTSPGCYASIQGPAEEPEWVAVCPQCRLKHDEYGDGS